VFFIGSSWAFCCKLRDSDPDGCILTGGAEGIKAVVDQLHAKGVKVLWPYHPWDHSTHNQEKNNVTDYLSMAEMLKATDSDGFNGDTMTHIPRGFYDAAVKIHRPIALEAEGGISSTWDLNYVTIGWGEGWKTSEPGALFVRPQSGHSFWDVFCPVSVHVAAI